MLIAVDFDGTIVEHEYPRIGRERPFAIVTLKKIQAEGHRLVLWTYREGLELQEAIDWCAQRGLEFDCVNSDDPLQSEPRGPRKINAEMYIDDRNVGGLPDWGAIYEMVHNGWSYRRYISEMHARHNRPEPRRSLLQRLFGRD